MSELVVLTTNWIFEISYRSGCVGLLVLPLLLFVIKTSTLPKCSQVKSFLYRHRHYFGICLSKLALLPYSPGRSCCYSNRLYDFSVISRCYKDAYVSSKFSHTVRLRSSLPTKRFSLIYDLNGFKSTIRTVKPVQTTTSLKRPLV